MRILGIESSCDETSVALLAYTDDAFQVLREQTASQVAVHRQYGGVVPEVAGREHAEHILPVIEEVLHGQKRPDAIAVTAGPGLITGLVIGVTAAKTLSYLWQTPLIAVNHIEGHIYSALLRENGPYPALQFPCICLIVSGGHTELILMRDHGAYTLLGKTRDDAAGECLDKVASLVGLSYPGGPQIARLGAQGNPRAIALPRPMMEEDNYEFSFAGLKTAAKYFVRDHPLAAVHVNPLHSISAMFGQAPEPATVEDFCASVEAAVVDVLVAKTLRAAAHYQPKTIVLGGGVSANGKLRETLRLALVNDRTNTSLLAPETRYATDNGAMIAAAAYHHAKKKEFISWKNIAVDPNWTVYKT